MWEKAGFEVGVAFCLVAMKAHVFQLQVTSDKKVCLERFHFRFINNIESVVSIMCLFIV